MNPVVLLDEVDKVGADYRGDGSRLLEVLDPLRTTPSATTTSSSTSTCRTCCSSPANVVESIPSALLDRMELVTLDGYTEDDKVAIARDFLLPRQLEGPADLRRGHRDRCGTARDGRQLHPGGGCSGRWSG